MYKYFKFHKYAKVLFIVLVLPFVFISCNNKKKKIEKWRHVEIYPLDKSQVITIITKGNKRYVMNGVHSEIPKEDYLLLDISKVDALGDGISVCWNDSGYRWKFRSVYATIIENKLDTTKFIYYQRLGKYGEPISAGYKKKNCGGVMIREHQQPRGNLIIKYIPASKSKKE